MTRKVLIVTYHFPPANTMASLRMRHLMRGLPQRGWQPHVLTIDSSHARNPNPALLDDLPGDVRITRTRLFDPRRVLRGRRSEDLVRSHASTEPPVAVRSAERRSSGLRSQMGRFARRNLWIPDDAVGWLIPAVRAGLRIIRSESIDLIYATLPPMTATLIAGTLQKRTQLPFVAEYRDDWGDTRWAPDEFGWSRRVSVQFLDAWLPRRWDHLIALSSGIRTQVLQRHQSVAESSVSTIYNAYEASAFSACTYQGTDKFTCTYTGTLSAYRDIRPLFRALEIADREGQVDLDRIRLRFFGRVDADQLRGLGQQIGVETFLGGVAPHQEIPDLLVQSDLLLLLKNGEDTIHIPGKLFEYLGAGRPVLMIGPTASEAAEILRSSGAGKAFETGDAVGMSREIATRYQHWKLGARDDTPTGDRLAYSADRMVDQISDVFDKTVRDHVAVGS